LPPPTLVRVSAYIEDFVAMPAHPSEFPLHIVEEDSRVTVGFPANTTLSEANAEEFSRELLALAEKRPHLLVDLGGVAMLTSIILAKFIALNGRVRSAGGRLTLFNPTPVVQQVFKVTRLDTILELHPFARPIPA
jgi:anti-anti-sigma factor